MTGIFLNPEAHSDLANKGGRDRLRQENEAHALLEDLIAMRELAARGAVLNTKPAGMLGAGQARHGPQPGRGLECADLRPYQRGDDARDIDWKVTARHGKPFTKVFHSERERPLWLVVDLGPSMHFGSVNAFKAIIAARAAAWLAWVGSIAGDRVGGAVCGAAGVEFVRPRTGDHGVFDLLAAVCRTAVAAGAASSSPTGVSLPGALAHLRPGVRTGDRICAISDFYFLSPTGGAQQLTQALGSLQARCEFVPVHVTDPLEVHVPPADLYPVVRGDGAAWLDLNDQATRTAWSAGHLKRVEILQELSSRHGWPMITLSTEDARMVALTSRRSLR